MFETLIRTVTHLVRNVERFDPASLNDPVALKTAWRPAKRGGTNFRTHRLVPDGMQRIVFRPTPASWLFAAAFVGSGPLMAALFYLKYPFPLGNIPPTMLLVIAGCGVFSLIGVYFAARNLGTMEFDGVRRVYAARGLRAGFDNIHALQIVSEYCGGGSGSVRTRSFVSYELNLVLKNGERINLCDHGNIVRLREDAARLAEFLGRPLWDAA